MLIKRKGQSTLEYAMIIMVIAAGIIAMQVYMKRGIQGKLRDSTDSIGKQYSAGETTSKITTNKILPSTTKETFGLDATGTFKEGVSRYQVVVDSEIQRTATGIDTEKIGTKLADEDLF